MFEFIHHVRDTYGEVTSKKISQLVKNTKKLEKCKAGIRFINECLKNECFPNFSRINLANDTLNNSERFVRYIRHQVTEKELENKYKIRKNLEKERRRLNSVSSTLSTDDWALMVELLNDVALNTQDQLDSRHRNKLEKLGLKPRFEVDCRNITNTRQHKNKIKTSIEDKESIFNLSSRILTSTEKRVLSKGLRFGIKSKKVDTFELLARFEQLAQSLDRLEIAKQTDERKANLNSRNAFLQSLQSMAFEFIELSKKARDSLTDEEHEALLELSKDKSIIITKADKGNAVVIQDVEEYRNKVTKILEADMKFTKLKDDVTRLRETRLQGYLRSLHKQGKLNGETYNKVLPCGSRAGVLYGLPKIHKANVPIRPIISAVKTYNYSLAKYLDEILKPLAINNASTIKDTFDFVNKVSRLDPKVDKYIVSFDVESLFTNIPTVETIEIILDLAFEKDSKFHNLNREDLRKLLVICTQESHFQFNGLYYDQVDGVAMGSPLGPLFANIFMNNFEKLHETKLKELGVNLWLRYVDDIFATLRDKENANQILIFLNNQHPNIKFTIELEKDGLLPFLDTSVKRGSLKYTTTVYHKKTFTGVYLNWTSLTAKSYKIGLIHCLLDRIWRICSDEHDRESETEKLRAILTKNEYPEQVVEREISKFAKSRSQLTTTTTKAQPEQSSMIIKRFIVLPYVNTKAESFAKRLKELVQTNYPQVEFNIAFKAPNEIGKLFPFKDNLKKVESRSLVIYKLRCKQCGVEYIGKTERILYHRIKEHQSSKTSACREHTDKNSGHEIDFDNIKILDSADNDFKLRMKELLHIVQRKPALNKQLSAQSQFELKTLIIAAHPQRVSGVDMT